MRASRPLPGVLCALLTIPAAVLAQHNVLTSAERKAGWTLLFDGSDTSPWRGTVKDAFPSDSWEVKDGCLHTRVGNPKAMSEDLVSRTTFRDFEMVFACRLTPGANTGVKYLVQKFLQFRGHEYALGFEMQMIDDTGHPAARRGPKFQSGAMYAGLPPTEATARPIGEWNEGRIVLRDKAVQHWLNGVKVVEHRLDDGQFLETLKTAPGTIRHMAGWDKWDTPVSLQYHGGDVWFRDIKIKRLP